MRKETALPIRLETDTKNRLQKAARAMGVTPSALIRILISSFVDDFERGGGRVLFPPQWRMAPLIAESETNYGGRDKPSANAPAPGRAVLKKIPRKS